MTVFVVLLILAMLGAIGVFAARSAQLGVSNSGRYRQMVQTHYVAAGGMQGAIAEFGRDPHGYLVQMRNSPSVSSVTVVGTDTFYPCEDIPFIAGLTPASTACLRIGTQAIDKAAQNALSTPAFQIFEPVTAANQPGTLGFGNATGNFSVEFTDERPANPPPAGMPVAGNGGSKMKFRTVTARAVGQILPTDPTGAILATSDPAQKFVTSVETIRAEIVVGPVP